MSVTDQSEAIKRNTAKTAKPLKSALKTTKRAVQGVTAEYLALPNFISNSKIRNDLYSELAKEYTNLNASVNDWTMNSSNAVAKEFWRYASEDLPKGASVATFGSFSTKYLNDIISGVNPSTVNSQVAINPNINKMLTSDLNVIRSSVTTTLAEGAVEGLTRPEMTARMKEKVIGKTGTFSFVDSGGKRWSADNYFAMLNRSLNANVARDSYISTMTDAGYDLARIVGGVTGSSAEDPSDPCDEWAGEIISMTGATSGYPTLEDARSAGVFHVNCVHSVTALAPSEYKELEPDAGGK